MKAEGRRQKEEGLFCEVTLGEVAEPRREKVTPSEFPELPYIGLEHVEAHTMRLLGCTRAGEMASTANRFYCGDVLYSRLRPYLNKVIEADRDGLCSSEFIVFPPSKFLTSSFLKYRLNAADFVAFASSLNAGDRPRVDFFQISSFKFLLPSSFAQSQIVAKLEELFSDLDAGVAELKAAQKKLAQYRQSLLKAAVEGSLTAEWRERQKVEASKKEELRSKNFSSFFLLTSALKERRVRWEEKQLAKFKEQGKTPPKGWQDKYPEPVQPDTINLPELPDGWVWASVDQVGEVFLGKMLDKTKHQTGAMLPYLRNISVRWGSIETHDLPEMYYEEDELERYGLASGDVLVCEGGEPGRAAVCGKEHEKLKYQKALHRVRLFSLYESDLLVFYLEHLAKTGMLEQYFTGSTIKHFTKESFIALPIPLPPICEQSEIVEHLKLAIQCAQEQDAAIIHSLTQAAAQRKNILKSAFSGQLVPQDLSDEPASLLLERIRAERQKQAVKPKPKQRLKKQEAAQ